MKVDNRGIKIGESVLRKAEPGNDVQLNIDIDAQKVAEDSLAQGMDGARHLIDPDHGGYYVASGGAVAVLDARTGAVVALSSAPTFDPNAIVMGGAPPVVLRPEWGAAAHQSRAQPLRTRVHLQALHRDGHVEVRHSHRRTRRSSTTAASSSETTSSGATRERPSTGTSTCRRALTVSSDVFFYNVGKEFWNVYDSDEGGDDGTGAPARLRHPGGRARRSGSAHRPASASEATSRAGSPISRSTRR